MRSGDVLIGAVALVAGVWVVGAAALPADVVPVPPPPAAAPLPPQPEPHVYAATLPSGNVQYLTLSNCGAGCFTLGERRYVWMPDGQWRTPRYFDPAGAICVDDTTEGTWSQWLTNDAMHFSSDTVVGDYCGETDVALQPVTFTLTPAY